VRKSAKGEIFKMTNEELKTKIEKEEKDLQVLKEKKAKIETQIKSKLEKVTKYKNEMTEKELKELKANLTQSGMSLSELQRAIAKGDLSEIQNKLKGSNSPNQ